MTNSVTTTQATLSLSFLFSGAALVVTIFSGLPLLPSLSIASVLALLVFLQASHRFDSEEKQVLSKDIKKAIAIGVAATSTYDVVRLALYSTSVVNFYPFETFRLFGNALIGANTTSTLAFVVGACYHLLNGVTFSIAYRLAFKGRDFKYGIGAAMGLEALMLIAYPNWIDLSGKMNDFLAISFAGHFAYGVTVGVLNQAGSKGDAHSS